MKIFPIIITRTLLFRRKVSWGEGIDNSLMPLYGGIGQNYAFLVACYVYKGVR